MIDCSGQLFDRLYFYYPVPPPLGSDRVVTAQQLYVYVAVTVRGSRCLTRFGFSLRKEVERDLVDTLGEGASGIDYEDFIDSIKGELK